MGGESREKEKARLRKGRELQVNYIQVGVVIFDT